MSFFNRIGNAKNPYQTTAKKVLCVCSAGLLRSPTMANVLYNRYGFNTRAVGTSKEFALIPVDDVLLEWADEIVCADTSVRQDVLELMKECSISTKDRKVHSLEIPDIYKWNSSDLREIITQKAISIWGEPK